MGGQDADDSNAPVAPTTRDVTNFQNASVESFPVHLRNVLDFLYHDAILTTKGKPRKVWGTDVIAEDFFVTQSDWPTLRNAETRKTTPNAPPISATLLAAHARANHEIAHLTTHRLFPGDPGKPWPVHALYAEVRPIMKVFAKSASQTFLAPNVRQDFG